MAIEKKVLLQPLERLDLEDVQGIQNIVHDQVSRLLGGLVTTGGGLLKKWDNSSTINNSSKLIAFSDFSFFARTISGDDATQGSVCVHRTTATNGNCDFTTAQALTQIYYSTNSALPPTPTSIGYISGTHAQYYPPIYAKRVLSSGSTQNRRFWSVVDGAEITQAIATRQIESTLFHVGVPSDLGDDGESWSLIGRITQWTLSGSTVQLSLSGITPYYLADQLVGNSSTTDNTSEWIANDSPAGIGGLQEGMEHLKSKINDINVSLTALTASLNAFIAKKKRGSATLKHILDLRNPYSNALTISQNTADDFNLDIRQDYEPVEHLGTITTPYTAQKVNASSDAVQCMLASYVVLVDQSYFDKLFTCTLNTLIPMTDIVDGVGTIYFRDQDTKGFDILMDGNVSNVATANKIKLVQYTDASGTTQTGYGFKIRRRDFLNTSYAQDIYNIAMLSIDVVVG
jgi:hypothetical protein